MRGKSFGPVASPVQRVGAPAGGSAPISRLIVASTSGSGTKTLTAPISGTYRLVLMGAGGEGGAAAVSRGVAGGGGSGGVCVSRAFALNAGASVTVSIGANGGSGLVSNAATPGANGNPTTATAPNGDGLVANGGRGGGAGSNTAVAGGAGGTATGGEFNFTGNAGGGASTSGTPTASAGGSDTITVSGQTFSLDPGQQGFANSSLAAGGGANSTAALGFLTAAFGSAGANGNPQQGTRTGTGSGGAAVPSGSIFNGGAQNGIAHLVIEVPLS